MLSYQVNNVKKWFNEKHIKIQDIWLTQCVEYFLSENQNMSLQNLQEEAFQQWLLNDLADTTSNSLPELDKTTKVLPGSFVLQIQKLIDISASAYSQIQKLYNLPVEQTEEEMEKEKSSRVLKLFLSDGTIEIQAMEYRQIKCLSLNTAPGSKVILKGPINVSSSGMLYLENHHVTFLGGEVETLLEPNSVINTLLKSINLSADSSLLKNNKNIAIKPLQSEIIDSNTREASTISTSSNTNVVNNFETNILLDDPLADAFLEEFDLHNINDAPDVDLDKTFMRVQECTQIEPEPEETKNVLDPSYPIKLNNKSVIFFKQVDEIQSMIMKPKMFVVVIKIEKFIEKLCMEEDEWKNLVRVSDYLVDSTSFMDIKLDSDLISKYTGYDSQKMAELKIQLKDNPEKINDLLMSLKRMKEDFMNKIFLAEIKIFPQILTDQPSIIVSLNELQSEHRKLLEDKRNYD